MDLKNEYTKLLATYISVSIEDLRKGLTQLYEFLKNYDYIEATTRIKS